MVRSLQALAVTGWLAALPLAAQTPITLDELAELARQRLAAAQPRQLEALQPFLADLELDYDAANRGYLDGRFAQAAALGDAVVPVLLDKLAPAEEGNPKARYTAANAARILLRMDPSGFVDALLEVMETKNYTAQLQAIRLLGHSRSRVAAQALTTALGQTNGTHRVEIVEALRRLRAAGAADAVAPLLGTDDDRLRLAVLRYLTAVRGAGALPTVLQALQAEPGPALLGDFVRYLEVCAPSNGAAADALLRWARPAETDREQLELICRAWAVIAPRQHQPALAVCRSVLELGETGGLGLACAMTMRELGDRDGIELLLNKLKQQIRRDPRDALLYVKRAEALAAIEQWDRAVRDYQAGIDRAQNRPFQRELWLRVARCEAHRQRWSAVLKALKESRANHAAIRLAARHDAALAKALQQGAIKRYVDSLPGAPGAGAGR